MEINKNFFSFGNERRIEVTKTSAATIGGLKITNAAGVNLWDKSAIYIANTGIGIYIKNGHSSAHSAIMLREETDSASHMLYIEHKATAAYYGININNTVGSATSFVIHNYSSDGYGAAIDNVGTKPLLRLRNARNETYVPGVLGTGHLIDFERFDASLESLGHIDDECDFYFSKTGGLNGVCLLDRTLGTYYRLLVNNGTLSVEAVA
jgi:hypothetical protein